MRWEVRWRDPDMTSRRRAFATRDEAEAFDLARRTTPQQAASSVTVADLWPAWIDSKAGSKPSHLRDLRMQWRVRVEPEWGDRSLASITHSEVARWVGRIAAESPSAARRSLGVLAGICKAATSDGLLAADPTADVRRPALPEGDVRPLTVEQVRAVAEECAPHQLVVWTLATTGLRFGEMAALRVRDLDVDRRRLRVSRSITSVDSRPVESQPKGGRHRDVPVPAWLVDDLTAHVQGRPPGELLFSTRTGAAWTTAVWRKRWAGMRKGGEYVPGARERAGLPGVRVHDLRHTAASWAIAAGADIKTLQRMLGHASAAMTLDRYGHLMGDSLDDIGAAMDTLTRGS